MSYLSCYFPGILRDSGLYYKLEKLVKDSVFVIYGDPAYPLRRLFQKPYGGAVLSPDQIAFNRRMSTVRQAVEWGYGKVAAEFVFVDFNKNQKILLQKVPMFYRVATILANCHTCLYGSQVTRFFNLDAPSIQQYLTSARH